jgi:hypothetical protein
MNKRHRGRKPRTVTTAAGDVRLSRVYFECPSCRDGGYPLDVRLGVEGRYSQQAQRLICLAAASWSYDVSSERLEELCSLKVSDTTIREIAQRHGAAANAWLRSEPEAVREFREETGDVEFTTDGTSVNTSEGWREMKVGIFSKRDRGQSATPEEWDSRSLPSPKVRIAFAAIEDSESFGSRWKAWRKRLGLPDTSAITVLADGAKWIWEEQRKHLRDADGVLDVFHALEHVADLAKILSAEPGAVTAWNDVARDVLLHHGFSGIERFVQTGAPTRTASQQQAVEGLLNYLAPHQHHLNYAQRLAAGQSIGSGQVEGACKNLIGRRLKQTGARWRVRRVNRMAGLCSLMYSHQWKTYWETT